MPLNRLWPEALFYSGLRKIGQRLRKREMKEKILETVSGVIHYWINDIRPDRKTLVFLPGLTADHHLFDRQTEAFEKEFNLLAWDAPGEVHWRIKTESGYGGDYDRYIHAQ